MLKVIGLCVMFILGMLITFIGMADSNNGRGWRATIVGLYLITLAAVANMI